MKTAAIFMAVLLALSLTGCMDGARDRGSSAANPVPGVTGGTNGTGTTGSGTGTNNGGTGSGSGTGTNNGGTGSGSGTGMNNGGAAAGNGTGHTDADDAARTRSVMYNGDLYDVTAELLDDDEVGLELFSISEIVDDTPAADGNAAGLDKGTKVYRIRDDNEYYELAVEIGDAYYRAVRRG